VKLLLLVISMTLTDEASVLVMEADRRLYMVRALHLKGYHNERLLLHSGGV
jgi:hypothetical protein